jgi:uncharacterized protein (UPF0261 family)
MSAPVVIIGTLDTKGPEIAYLRDRIQALGLTTTVVIGILEEPPALSRISPAPRPRLRARRSTRCVAPGRGGRRRHARISQEIDVALYRTGRLGAIVSMGARKARSWAPPP